MEQDIYINQIHLDREALRSSLDPEYIRTLAEDIQRRGLLQAIVVRAREGGGWRLVAGRCRLEACKSLGYTTIPARIIEDGDPDEIDGLQENLVRKQMNPLEEARAVKMLQEKYGYSQRELCERLNRGTAWVQDRLMLLDLPQNLQEAVANRQLSISAAALLAQIPDQDYRDYLLSIAKVNGCTVHQAEAWLLDYQARSRALNPTGTQPTELRLPMRPPDPVCNCGLCGETVLLHLTQLIRVCPDCVKTLNQTILQTTPQTPQPPHDPTTSAASSHPDHQPSTAHLPHQP